VPDTPPTRRSHPRQQACRGARKPLTTAGLEIARIGRYERGQQRCGHSCYPLRFGDLSAQTLTAPHRTHPVLTLSSTPSVPVCGAGVHPPAAHDVRRAPAAFVAEVDHVPWAAGSTWCEPDTLARRSPPNSLITFQNWWSGAGRTAGLRRFRRIRGVAACCQAWPGRPAGCKTMAGGCLMWPDVCRRWLPVWLP